MVKPKSDAYLVRSTKIDENELNSKNYYLNEESIKNYDHEVIINSGISIKRIDSLNYQIHKFTPSSFSKVFKNNFLGAGTMIYTKKIEDVYKNQEIFQIWNVKEDDFYSYFSSQLLFDVNYLKSNLSEIQKYCNNKIKEIINLNEEISDLVFNGKGVFEPPFCAEYSFIKGKLTIFEKTDFIITTGSGRLKSPTVVVKPKIT